MAAASAQGQDARNLTVEQTALDAVQAPVAPAEQSFTNMTKDMRARNRPNLNIDSGLTPIGRGPAGEWPGSAPERNAARSPRASRPAFRGRETHALPCARCARRCSNATAKDERHDPGRPFPGRTRLAVRGGSPPASQPAGTSIEAVQPETVQPPEEAATQQTEGGGRVVLGSAGALRAIQSSPVRESVRTRPTKRTLRSAVAARYEHAMKKEFKAAAQARVVRTPATTPPASSRRAPPPPLPAFRPGPPRDPDKAGRGSVEDPCEIQPVMV